MKDLENPASKIFYKGGFKYQLTDSYRHQLPFSPPRAALDEWIQLDETGLLTVRHGYAWDGPSGPTIDTKNFMRGSLVHDALYQLLREGLLPENYRPLADNEMHRICLEDGMSHLRAWYVLRGVRLGGGPSASQEAVRRTLRAP